MAAPGLRGEIRCLLTHCLPCILHSFDFPQEEKPKAGIGAEEWYTHESTLLEDAAPNFIESAEVKFVEHNDDPNNGGTYQWNKDSIASGAC